MSDFNVLLYKITKKEIEGCSKALCPFVLIHHVWRASETKGARFLPTRVYKQKEGGNMGRTAKISSRKKLEELWEQYKNECDNQMVLVHDFSSKNSEFVSKELKRSTTYTIAGFCVFVGISRQSFYQTYAKDEKYVDIVTRMREECEVDARKKFELQMIPSQLAGLWMSKYGYSTKQDTNVSATLPEEKTKLDSIIEQLSGDEGER